MVVVGIRWLTLLLLLWQVPLWAQVNNPLLSTAVHLRGVVVPDQQIKISFSRSGLLSELVEEGSLVKSGAVLARIDTAKAQAELKQSEAKVFSARAELAAANHSLNKLVRLIQENILSDIALVEAKFSVDVARAKLTVTNAQLEVARQSLADCTIKAPFDGAVVSLMSNKGEWVNTGDPFVEFADLANLTLSLDLPLEMFKGLARDHQTKVLAQGREIGSAKVKRIFPMIDPASGLRRVVWVITPNQGELLSGRYVSLESWQVRKRGVDE